MKLVPDSTGELVLEGRRYRVEPKWLILDLDFREARGPPDVSDMEAMLAAE